MTKRQTLIEPVESRKIRTEDTTLISRDILNVVAFPRRPVINMGPPLVSTRTDMLNNVPISRTETLNYFGRSLNNREPSTINQR